MAKKAGYARISSDREGQELGVTRQTEDIAKRAESNGDELVMFVENDTGASSRSRKKRPVYEEMLRRVQAGEFAGIIAATTSRLTRRPLEYERLIGLVETRGITIETVQSGGYDLTTADGRAVARTIAAWDAAEAERIGERVSRAHEQRRTSGKHHGAGTQFGYRAGMVTSPAEAAAIRTGAELLLRGGSVGDVIKAWDAAGVRPPKAAVWHWNVVRAIFLRPAIAGLVAHKGAIVGEGTWTPILDRPTWEAVCTVLARKERRPGANTRTHLLSGFLTCGRCGNYMSSRGVFYQCSVDRGGCGVKRNEAWLLDAVDGLVTAWLTRHDTGGEVAGAQAAVATLGAKIDQHEAKIREHRARFEADEIDAEDYYPTLRTWRAEVNVLKAQQADAACEAVAVAASDALAVWKGDDLTARRQILGRVLESVVVKPVGRIGRRKPSYDSIDVIWR